MRPSALGILFSFATSFSGCTSEDFPTAGEPLTPCRGRMYARIKKFERITGTVITFTLADSSNTKLYFIDAGSETGTIPLDPCNLPAKAKIEGLKIKFSGYLVSYRGLEVLNVRALPFQLTNIEP